MAPVLVLVRHAESIKNLTSSFAGSGSEALTSEGAAQTLSIAAAIETLVGPSSSVGIFASATARSNATATAIATKYPLTVLEDLRSIRSPYPGMTEQEVWDRDPTFIRLLSDYRLGLRSSYDIPRGPGEDVRAFENRVAAAVDDAISRGFEFTVVVGHRSMITASLLRIARILCGYPDGWYGHVAVPLGSISVIELDDSRRFSSVIKFCDTSHLSS